MDDRRRSARREQVEGRRFYNYYKGLTGNPGELNSTFANPAPLGDLLREPVRPVQPRHDLARRVVVDGAVALAQPRRRLLGQPRQPDILEEQDVALDHLRQLRAQDRARGLRKGAAILVGVARRIALRQRDRRDAEERRLQRRVHRVRRRDAAPIAAGRPVKARR